MTISFYSKNGQDELTVSNQNAWTLLELLGLDPDYCGSVRLDELAKRLECARRELSARACEWQREGITFRSVDEGVRIHIGGLDRKQLERYLSKLTLIGTSAAFFGDEKVTWA